MREFLRLSNRTFHRTKVTLLLGLIMLAFCVLGIRLGYLMLARSEHYSELATELHERERSIKASRGKILERNEPWKDFPIDPETGYAKDPNTGYLVDPETGAVVAGLDEIPSETSSEAGSEEPSAEKQE